MKVLILTGPPGAGKNTIAEVLAHQQERCATIDVDVIRWMVRQPHRAPWEGVDGHEQQLLGVRNACLLMEQFIHHEYDVIIHDVLSDETAKLYRTRLNEYLSKIVLLLPSVEEITRRNLSRPSRLKDEEVAMLYKSQEQLADYDDKIDNSKLSVEEVVKRLASMLSNGSV